MEELSVLKNFMEMGGVFVLALILAYGWLKKFDSIEDKLVKMLTLLAILVKTNTNFNGIESVLDNDAKKVADKIITAENNHT
jgi:hypothetical protein